MTDEEFHEPNIGYSEHKLLHDTNKADSMVTRTRSKAVAFPRSSDYFQDSYDMIPVAQTNESDGPTALVRYSDTGEDVEAFSSQNTPALLH